ncbi:unnamed protein product [Parascedosporium putredinis]|uniref:Pex19-domain-containing protein n=1 Tax=Parascedosporium putredinis TaxID=1442378 RepID=A0A9P1MC42_9PEZI|nr:unnamed protein product [Parascedosporium putredinis]CAI7995911.1 unnamed protein product [Parascedosporium putredinis]
MSAEQKVGDAVADEKKEIVAPEPSSIETKGTPKPEVVEDFPDPDEDDLDDLDARAPPAPVAAAEKTTAAPAPSASVEDDDALLDDELAKELEKGMASFFGGLEGSIAEATTDVDDETASAAATAGVSSAAGPTSDASFQDTIRRTMERMKTSENKTTEDLSKDEGQDMLNDLMGLLGNGALGGEGGTDDLNKMLLGMMEQLTNKDILYEPMKELHDQFPGWLEANGSKCAADDLKRYEEQRVIVADIVAKFDEPSYSDSNPAHREYIVEKMQKMQAAGSPPPDLVGDLQSAQEALNAPNDEACNPQ